MDNYTESVSREFIPLRLESASRQESTTEPTGVAQSGSGSLDIASLLKQDSPGGLLDQFLRINLLTGQIVKREAALDIMHQVLPKSVFT